MTDNMINNTAADLPVTVHAQYVKDFSFENPNAPDILKPSRERPQIDVNIVLDANPVPDENVPDLYESALTITAKATREGKTVFLAQIVYAALVSLKDAPADRINPTLYIDVPNLVFPFARQMIAHATASGGFPPLYLNPVDFRSMYLNQRREQKQPMQAAGHA
jgi:preprotein translocase subunit SecB